MMLLGKIKKLFKKLTPGDNEKALDETSYLLSSPANRENLMRGIAEFK